MVQIKEYKLLSFKKYPIRKDFKLKHRLKVKTILLKTIQKIKQIKINKNPRYLNRNKAQ